MHIYPWIHIDSPMLYFGIFYVFIWASLVAQLVKNPPATWRPGFDPWVGTIPWRRERLTTPVFWPGESHGLYNPWGHKESGITEQLSLYFTSWLDLLLNIWYMQILFWFKVWAGDLAKFPPQISSLLPQFHLLKNSSFPHCLEMLLCHISSFPSILRSISGYLFHSSGHLLFCQFQTILNTVGL